MIGVAVWQVESSRGWALRYELGSGHCLHTDQNQTLVSVWWCLISDLSRNLIYIIYIYRQSEKMSCTLTQQSELCGLVYLLVVSSPIRQIAGRQTWLKNLSRIRLSVGEPTICQLPIHRIRDYSNTQYQISRHDISASQHEKQLKSITTIGTHLNFQRHFTFHSQNPSYVKLIQFTPYTHAKTHTHQSSMTKTPWTELPIWSDCGISNF